MSSPREAGLDVDGGTGNDEMTACDDCQAHFDGHRGNDVLTGTDALLNGGAGDDILTTLLGGVIGGGGDDFLSPTASISGAAEATTRSPAAAPKTAHRRGKRKRHGRSRGRPRLRVSRSRKEHRRR